MFRTRNSGYRPLVTTAVGIGFVSVVLILVVAIAESTATVSGIVFDEAGHPVEGATVRIQATRNATITAFDGTFTLTGLEEGAAITVSAWKADYYCEKVEGVVPPAGATTFRLRRYQSGDNPAYEWMLPKSEDEDVVGCTHCMGDVAELWFDNAHAGSGSNPRFFSMYNGTDVAGAEMIAPGYVQDFEGTTGICATCHAPGAAIDAPFSTDMNALDGADTFGVHCDFCHKAAGVYLNPATGLPYDNVPGVLSMDVRRSFPSEDNSGLFFGPYDDVNTPEADTFLPLIQESEFCSPCHQFSFWGTPVYQSFSEWLEGPYAEEGVTCQACHMPAPSVLDGKTLTRACPVSDGGIERDPLTIRAHTQPGASDEDLLRDTIELELLLEPQQGGVVQANVSITNANAGHHVPTDYPGRQMILVVTATGADGQALPLIDGPTLSVWCGDQAGLPGVAYAKILRDVETGELPVISYWKQTLIESDNRIAALAADRSTYRFAVGQGSVTVRAVVFFRRLFQDIAKSKAWDMPDIPMEEAEVTVTLGGT